PAFPSSTTNLPDPFPATYAKWCPTGAKYTGTGLLAGYAGLIVPSTTTACFALSKVTTYATRFWSALNSGEPLLPVPPAPPHPPLPSCPPTRACGPGPPAFPPPPPLPAPPPRPPPPRAPPPRRAPPAVRDDRQRIVMPAPRRRDRPQRRHVKRHPAATGR